MVKALSPIAVLMAMVVTGCAPAGGGGSSSGSQVVVRLEAGTAGLDDATRTAEQACAGRGGRARLLAVVNPPPIPPHLPPSTRVPEAVFACDTPPR